MPTSGGPYDMNGILAELARLRAEVQSLRSERDKWERLYYEAVVSKHPEHHPHTGERPMPPDAPSMEEIQAEVREVRRARAKRKGLL